MRDPARIPRIVEKLARAWEAAPDMRLGQLCHCIVIRCDRYHHELSFSLEDDIFEDALDKWLSEPHPYILSKS